MVSPRAKPGFSLVNDSTWVARANDGRVAVHDIKSCKTSKFAMDESAFEIEMLNGTFDPMTSFLLNCCKKCNS